jgi:hypothetical protein
MGAIMAAFLPFQMSTAVSEIDACLGACLFMAILIVHQTRYRNRFSAWQW